MADAQRTGLRPADARSPLRMLTVTEDASAMVSALPLPTAVEAVRSELERLEAVLRSDTDLFGQQQRALLDWVFATGGKRLRPALVFAVARLAQSDRERVLALAASVETLHAATLVHDDLVDGSLVRRGQPTVNSRWTAGATVLAGDWLFARASRFAVATASLPVMEVFARTLGIMTEGELRQLSGRQGVPTHTEYEFRIYAKTAALFEAATEAAATLTCCSEGEILALARFGRELGMAFQIVDDILDFTGDSERLGKPVGGDLRVGTVTLPALLYLDAHPQARSWLTTPAVADGVERLIRSVRADETTLVGARDIAWRHLQSALANLAQVPASAARDDLEAIARFAVERDS